MELLIATHNFAKFDYFKKILKNHTDFNFSFLSLKDLGISKSAREDGANESENALQKAKFYFNLSNKLTLSDDAGMYIDELGGWPGVQARRWGGMLPDYISDEEWLEFFLKETKHIPKEKRTGEYRVAKAIYAPDGRSLISVMKRKFIFNYKPDWSSYKKGWPMSALYIDEKFKKPWIKMSNKELYQREKIFLDDFKNFLINKK